MDALKACTSSARESMADRINGLGLAAEGDDHLLALIADGSAQAPDILVDAIDDPLEQP